MRADQKQITGVNRQCDGLSPLSYVQCKAFHLNGVQTELKCKPNVKRCKRFVFVGHSPLLHHNTLKTKAITLFQADHILTRFVFPPLHEGIHARSSCIEKLTGQRYFRKLTEEQNDPSRTVILLNVTGVLQKLSKHRNLKSKVAICISYQLKIMGMVN